MVKFSDLIKISPEDSVVKGRFEVKKTNDDQMLAFGWASVTVTAGGLIVEDYHEDTIATEEIEKAAYEFVELYREGGEMHERGGCAVLIESMLFTKSKMDALGIADDVLPEGWWVGFRVIDPDVWNKVKDGTYPMFSIEGTAERVTE